MTANRPPLFHVEQRETLLALAARVEAASADEQRAVIESAAVHLALHRKWPPLDDDEGRALAGRFYSFLNAGAFLDAAMSLVPDGADWSLDSAGFYAVVNGKPGAAATPALALTAAALRALASEQDQ